MNQWTPEEKAILKKLNTAKKIQDFLDKTPINFELDGDSCMSPRYVMQEKRAHCVEGALFAAAALAFHGQKPLLLDLVTVAKDYDHVVALFRRHDHWGAISKTNHAVLRYREPVYKTVRELAMSYFHEYFMDDGKKTLRSFSRPFDLSKSKTKDWMTSEEDLWDLVIELDDSPHEFILNASMRASLRRADKVEIEAGKITEWKK